MGHLVPVTLYGWLSGMQGGMKHSFHPAYQTEINILRKNVHQVGFIYKITHNLMFLWPCIMNWPYNNYQRDALNIIYS